MDGSFRSLNLEDIQRLSNIVLLGLGYVEVCEMIVCCFLAIGTSEGSPDIDLQDNVFVIPETLCQAVQCSAQKSCDELPKISTEPHCGARPVAQLPDNAVTRLDRISLVHWIELIRVVAWKPLFFKEPITYSLRLGCNASRVRSRSK